MRRSVGSARSDASTFSSTTQASHTSTIRISGSTSPRSVGTRTSNISSTFATSTRPSPIDPLGMTVTTHTCRGNFRSSWAASGSYYFVAEALFNEFYVDGFFMEWDDDRSGGFDPLRFLPKGKQVVLGLLTSQHAAELEQRDEFETAHRGSGALHRLSTKLAPVSRRNAASPPPSKETTSTRRASKQQSCDSSSKSPTRSGATERHEARPLAAADSRLLLSRTCSRPAGARGHDPARCEPASQPAQSPSLSLTSPPPQARRAAWDFLPTADRGARDAEASRAPPTWVCG